MTDPQSAEAVRAGDARACGPGGEALYALRRQRADACAAWLSTLLPGEMTFEFDWGTNGTDR